MPLAVTYGIVPATTLHIYPTIMPTTDPSLGILAWWGAGLSTLLAIVKLAELWRDRFRVVIGYRFTSDSHVGNDILIRNLSNRPLILGHWQLLHCSGYWPRRHFFDIESADLEANSDVHIAPHSTFTLNFCGADHFDWHADALNGQRIFIRLHIVGRRPVLRLVYPTRPSNAPTRFSGLR